MGAPPPDRPLHHPRPGIYNAVSRSDRFGTGHRLGIQNAPAGGPSQITDHNKLYIKRGERGTVAALGGRSKRKNSEETPGYGLQTAVQKKKSVWDTGVKFGFGRVHTTAVL